MSAVDMRCNGQVCPDSGGDEIVRLPDAFSSHNYKIRVSTWEGLQRQVSACSPKFEIRGRQRPDISTPSPTHAPGDVLPPTTDPRAIGGVDGYITHIQQVLPQWLA